MGTFIFWQSGGILLTTPPSPSPCYTKLISDDMASTSAPARAFGHTDLGTQVRTKVSWSVLVSLCRSKVGQMEIEFFDGGPGGDDIQIENFNPDFPDICITSENENAPPSLFGVGEWNQRTFPAYPDIEQNFYTSNEGVPSVTVILYFDSKFYFKQCLLSGWP